MSNINITPLFPTLFTEQHLNIDNQKLVDYANSLRQQSPSRSGGWQSPWLEDLTQEPIAQLLDLVQQHWDQIASEVFSFPQEITIKITSAWINCNDPGLEQLNNNYYHLHGGNFLSSVYYVDCCEQSGNLILIPPHHFLDYALPYQLVGEQNLFTAQRYHVFAEQGKLVTFPSWINHFAEPNLSNTTRISIAVNGNIANK